MTRAAAAAAAAIVGASATRTAGACAGVDNNGDHGDGDDDCESSVLELSSGAYRMSKVKYLQIFYPYFYSFRAC